MHVFWSKWASNCPADICRGQTTFHMWARGWGVSPLGLAMHDKGIPLEPMARVAALLFTHARLPR